MIEKIKDILRRINNWMINSSVDCDRLEKIGFIEVYLKDK